MTALRVGIAPVVAGIQIRLYVRNLRVQDRVQLAVHVSYAFCRHAVILLTLSADIVRRIYGRQRQDILYIGGIRAYRVTVLVKVYDMRPVLYLVGFESPIWIVVIAGYIPFSRTIRIRRGIAIFILIMSVMVYPSIPAERLLLSVREYS